MTQPLEVTLQFGNFPVVECSRSKITIKVAEGSFFNLHVGTVPHKVKVGDLLPLFTRVPYGRPTN